MFTMVEITMMMMIFFSVKHAGGMCHIKLVLSTFFGAHKYLDTFILRAFE